MDLPVHAGSSRGTGSAISALASEDALVIAAIQTVGLKICYLDHRDCWRTSRRVLVLHYFYVALSSLPFPFLVSLSSLRPPDLLINIPDPDARLFSPQ